MNFVVIILATLAIGVLIHLYFQRSIYTSDRLKIHSHVLPEEEVIEEEVIAEEETVPSTTISPYHRGLHYSTIGNQYLTNTTSAPTTTVAPTTTDVPVSEDMNNLSNIIANERKCNTKCKEEKAKCDAGGDKVFGQCDPYEKCYMKCSAEIGNTALASTTLAPTTLAPTTLAPTTPAPTTPAPPTSAPTTPAPTTSATNNLDTFYNYNDLVNKSLLDSMNEFRI